MSMRRLILCFSSPVRAANATMLCCGIVLALGAVPALAAAGDAGSLVHLRAGRFDLASGPPRAAFTVPKGPTLEIPGAAARSLFIVQFHAGPTADQQERLELLTRGEVIDYVPDFAVLLSAPAADSAQIRALPDVRAAFALDPTLKLSPELARRLGPGAPAGEARLRVWFLRGVSGSAAAQAIRTLFPGAHIEYVFEHPVRPAVTLRVPAADFRSVVGGLLVSDQVYVVEPAPEWKLANDQFVSRAPADVVEREREKEQTWREQRETLAAKLGALGC